MSQYFLKDKLSWAQSPVRGGIDIEKSVIWEGDCNVRSAFFNMPAGMLIPEHTHPSWVQVMVVEGEMKVETEQDGVVCITAGGCYFVEPGDSHKETAVGDTLVLVTQAEDRPEFLHSD
ncbi:MAG: cupin domain-containing protein [Gammaproteobacteria bacterium]|jgi:quercetin dioxygenase-like cupin family protein|nr:cupin domain-containing protein [Gammaproteobacteria bacterium]